MVRNLQHIHIRKRAPKIITAQPGTERNPRSKSISSRASRLPNFRFPACISFDRACWQGSGEFRRVLYRGSKEKGTNHHYPYATGEREPKGDKPSDFSHQGFPQMASSDESIGPSAAESDYATCLKEANRRSERYRNADPFPHIPRALLSSEHIKAYVRETGMIYPFDPGHQSLKSASYEVRARRAIYILGPRRKEIVQPIKRVRDIYAAAQINQLCSDRLRLLIASIYCSSVQPEDHPRAPRSSAWHRTVSGPRVSW